jgi:hypothetical protein
MVRSRAIIMCVVSGKTPAADLPHRAVVLIMVGRVFVTFEAIREGSGRPRLLAFLARKESKAPLWNCSAFKTIAAILIYPF